MMTLDLIIIKYVHPAKIRYTDVDVLSFLKKSNDKKFVLIFSCLF